MKAVRPNVDELNPFSSGLDGDWPLSNEGRDLVDDLPKLEVGDTPASLSWVDDALAPSIRGNSVYHMSRVL